MKHKQPADSEALNRLTELQTKLLDRRLRFAAHKYYECGNKCGRMLARALLKLCTSVHNLQSPMGKPVHHTSKIASMFYDYYAALYNLDSACCHRDIANKQSCIKAYLSSSGLPNLSPEQQADIEITISTIELLATVKSLPNGKSPGPDGFTKSYYLKFFTKLQAHMCTLTLWLPKVFSLKVPH